MSAPVPAPAPSSDPAAAQIADLIQGFADLNNQTLTLTGGIIQSLAKLSQENSDLSQRVAALEALHVDEAREAARHAIDAYNAEFDRHVATDDANQPEG